MSQDFGINDALKRLGVEKNNLGTSTGVKWVETSGEGMASYSPADGKLIASVQVTDKSSYDQVMNKALLAFKEWRMIPAPQRGEIVRQVGNALRELKEDLGKLVSYEMGKSYQEGLGEVQEMIDICDFAVGLSRQLYGLTMHSERPSHRMYEQWHPLGVVGIISAFNFPVAVWSWNAMIALVCGNVCVWKPSEKAPLSAIACQHIISKVLKGNNVPEGVSCLINGDYRVGEYLAKDKRVPLVSATGSTRMGKLVAQVVGQRLGKTLLELGGNNAMIVSQHADLDIAIRASLFGAVGTAGQRCTTTRRLIVHDAVYEEVKNRLRAAYQKLVVGNPLDEANHVGPLIDKEAVKMYLKAIDKVKNEGGKELVPGGVLDGVGFESGCYVTPCIIEAENHYEMVQHETFAPILYMIRYNELEEAIEIQNAVPQGLSSAIMTMHIRESELFLSAAGSDCGIANVNIGTSGAEIGGAFGGEKETGGGRESGSDSWKAYMRRQTNTINYGDALPLAQGIKFEI
ncbi:aldehyde dehydrogenase family protein [Belliella sp. DSM 111904]|uniref:aldehyde dehydrogenase (NAD(+)) n=1 Tax=Belliella filtrata TaxID=2923435 RepID=A0ABS9V401_9BACT|nr:aldehyde dehydrogenase family protein [Belliella filtrata]MCH7411138.1 aldehyde dehydrogenase family protein [Belliella filtrata]